MKHLFALIVAICFCTLLYAQEKISLGFKGGINIPELGVNSSDPVVSGYKTELSPYYGAVLECGLNKRWSIMTEINYLNTTITKNGITAIPQSAFETYGIKNPSDSNLYGNFYSKIRLRYLEVPLMLKYYIYQKEKINFYVYGGAFTGILLNGNVKTQGRSKVYKDAAQKNPFLNFNISFNVPSIDIIDWLNPISFGVQAGVGFTFKSDFGEFFANLNTTHGFVTIQANPGDGDNKTKELNFAVGYLFHLSK